jgi:hypothetical protein
VGRAPFVRSGIGRPFAAEFTIISVIVNGLVNRVSGALLLPLDLEVFGEFVNRSQGVVGRHGLVQPLLLPTRGHGCEEGAAKIALTSRISPYNLFGFPNGLNVVNLFTAFRRTS